MWNNRSTHAVRGIRRGFSSGHLSYLLLHIIIMLVGWILISYASYVSGDPALAMAIGSGLIAAGAAGAVLFLKVWVDREEDQRLKALRESGIKRTFQERSVAIRPEYDDRLASASEVIEIMGFGLRNLRHDHEANFEAWSRRAKVRILLIDPEFPQRDRSIANLRDVEEGDGKITEDVRKFVRSCAELLRSGSEDFQVRLYTCLPSINLFRVDGELFWGPYLVGDVSRNLPTLLMEADSRLSRRLIAHFDMVWSDFSRDVPDEWLEVDAEIR